MQPTDRKQIQKAEVYHDSKSRNRHVTESDTTWWTNRIKSEIASAKQQAVLIDRNIIVYQFRNKKLTQVAGRTILKI